MLSRVGVNERNGWVDRISARIPDTGPVRTRVDGEHAHGGPAGREAGVLYRGVRVERRETQDAVSGLGHEQAPVTGVCAQVELVGQVPREDLGCELVGVLGVRAEHDPADRFVIGGLRAADEQRAHPLGCRDGFGF